MLHDTYAVLYDSYRVVSSKVKVTSIANASSTVLPCFWGVFVDEDATLDYTLATAAIEDKTRTKGYRQSVSGITTMQGNARLSAPMSASFNSKRRLSKEGQMETTIFGLNPVALADNFFLIWAGSVLGNDPGVAAFLVEIEYIVELTDPINVAQS